MPAEAQREFLLSLPEPMKLRALEVLKGPEQRWRPLPGPQTRAYESPADILLFGGSSGGGKRLAIDTPVPTPSGWTIMGELRPGDLIFGRDGKPCRVLVAHPIEWAPETYRVEFDDGTIIFADAAHLWLTFDAREMIALTHRTEEWRAHRRAKRPSRCSGRKSARFTASLRARNAAHPPQPLPPPTGSVRTTTEIAATVCALARQQSNHAIPVAGALDLPDARLPLDPYVFGVWLGDGSSYGQGLTCADKGILDEIRAAGYEVRKWSMRYEYGICGIKGKLHRLGVLRNKHIPPVYLRASRAQRLALLQGLMDTDGHACNSGSVEFTNTNRALADGVLELALSLGHKATITEGLATLHGRVIGPKYRIHWTPLEIVFRLPRKAAIQRVSVRRTTRFRYVVACDRVDPVPMRCITVDAPDGLYLVSRAFVPTHNSDLALGLARNEHHRSIIFRRVSPSLRALVERSREIYAPDGIVPGDSFRESPYPRWRFDDGRVIRFGSLQYDTDVTDYQGQPHDFYCFDELAEFTEYQFRFVIGWNRTTRSRQRCRIVGTSNPPTTAEGEWIIPYWGPWLDPNHPHPAKPGELRWYTTLKGRDVEMPNGDPVEVEGPGGTRELVYPRSRTFIPARVQDNPYLVASGYVSTLQALPEPLRSKLLYGDFAAGRDDAASQVIPSEWVALAQARWRQRPRPSTPMSALGVDVARGGRDQTVLTPRYDNWIAEQLVSPGKSTPDGQAVAALVLRHHRDDAPVNVDVIGCGGSPYDCLRNGYVDKAGDTIVGIGSRAIAMNGASASRARDKSGKLGFVNARAEWYWGLREALDPKSGHDLALPPDPELRADLCAPTWKLTPRGILIESKEDLTKRLHRSPDKGDSCVYAVAIPQPSVLIDTTPAQLEQENRWKV